MVPFLRNCSEANFTKAIVSVRSIPSSSQVELASLLKIVKKKTGFKAGTLMTIPPDLDHAH